MAAYHEQQLAAVQERVRAALEASAAGELDAFEVDELIHGYTRAARERRTEATGDGPPS